MCRFCGADIIDGQRSKSHNGVCKLCRAMIVAYSRDPECKYKEVFEKICKNNITAGRYVPNCFVDKPTQAVCTACGETFAKRRNEQCPKCIAMENRYKVYLQRPCSTSFLTIEAKYLQRYNKGLVVPKVWRDHHGL